MQIKLTFENDAAHNGSSVAWARSEGAALGTLREWLTVASQRGTATTITILVTPTPQAHRERTDHRPNRATELAAGSRCDCEGSGGFFHSTVPGILGRLENGRLALGAKVERCDVCRRYRSDDAAFVELVRRGLADVPANLASALEPFFRTIEANGGVKRDHRGWIAPLGDPEWIDLGEAYYGLCGVMGREPRWAEQADLTDEGTP